MSPTHPARTWDPLHVLSLGQVWSCSLAIQRWCMLSHWPTQSVIDLEGYPACSCHQPAGHKWMQMALQSSASACPEMPSGTAGSSPAGQPGRAGPACPLCALCWAPGPRCQPPRQQRLLQCRRSPLPPHPLQPIRSFAAAPAEHMVCALNFGGTALLPVQLSVFDAADQANSDVSQKACSAVAYTGACLKGHNRPGN